MKTVHQLIEEQVRRWEFFSREKKKEKILPVITLSREPGSGGKLVAQAVAQRLSLELFDEALINAMAEDANTSTRVIRTLDERGLSIVEEWVSALFSVRHLWPDELSKTLMRVIGTISRHGNAIIIGRGANFVLPPENRFRVRIIAPFENRVNSVGETYKISKQEARQRVLKTESDRMAFVRKYYYSDIRDPVNYDMVLNTGTLSIDAAATAICNAVKTGLS